MKNKTKIQIGLHLAAIVCLLLAFFIYIEAGASQSAKIFFVLGLLIETFAMALVALAWRDTSPPEAADERN